MVYSDDFDKLDEGSESHDVGAAVITMLAAGVQTARSLSEGDSDDDVGNVDDG